MYKLALDLDFTVMNLIYSLKKVFFEHLLCTSYFLNVIQTMNNKQVVMG